MQNYKAAAELGRSIIADHLIQGGPGDPDALELAATLCNFSAAMVEALREIVRCIRGGDETAGFSMDDALEDADAILARIEGGGGIMAQAKHTPGPWDFVTSDNSKPPACLVVDREGEALAVLPFTEQGEANAAFMAEAPAMLEALRAAVACLRGFSASADFGPLDDEAVSAGLAVLERIEATPPAV